MNMHRFAAKFVTRLLTPDQKDYSVPNDVKITFVSRVINGDETWVCGYDRQQNVLVQCSGASEGGHSAETAWGSFHKAIYATINLT